MSAFNEYAYRDKDIEGTVVARRVTDTQGEEVVLPGGERVHAAKGDYVIKIPASAYGYHEVVRAKDEVLAANPVVKS